MTSSHPEQTATYLGIPESLASRLRWLESTCGTLDLDKFLNAKIQLKPHDGQYVRGLWREPSAAAFLSELLDQLKQGAVVPLCDVERYYANQKRWPNGMQLSSGRMIDVW